MNNILPYIEYEKDENISIQSKDYFYLYYFNNKYETKDPIILSGFYNCKELINYFSIKKKIKDYHFKILAYNSKKLYIFEKNIRYIQNNIELIKTLGHISLIKGNIDLYNLLDINYYGYSNLVEINYIIQYALNNDIELLEKYLIIYKKVIDKYKLFDTPNVLQVNKLIYFIIEHKGKEEIILTIIKFIFENNYIILSLNDKIQYMAIANDNNYENVIQYLLKI